MNHEFSILRLADSRYVLWIRFIYKAGSTLFRTTGQYNESILSCITVNYQTFILRSIYYLCVWLPVGPR